MENINERVQKFNTAIPKKHGGRTAQQAKGKKALFGHAVLGCLF